MIDIGQRIAAARKAKGLRQNELARRAQIAPAQLCKVEIGRINPSFLIVERIVEALDSTIPELLYDVKPKRERKAKGDEVSAAELSRENVRYIPIRSAYEHDGPKALSAIEADEAAPSVGRPVASVCTLVWNRTSGCCEGAGAALAEDLRVELGIGTAPVGDLASALRFRGVRVLETKLAKAVGSISYWDMVRKAPVIVLDSGATTERRLYRLAYELGSVVLYASLGVRLDETLDQHRFLTDFTAAFLLPGLSVRTCVAATGVSPSDWTLAKVLPLKAYFGVSAESFILRLEELGLIHPKLRLAMRDKLRAYYKKHPAAMEPQPNGVLAACDESGWEGK